MKKIDFTQHILPHLVAIGIFLLVTVLFFKPVFFDNKKLEQEDIRQWEGSSKALRDYREQTGEEGLWAESMFSGMPAYLVNVEWGNKVLGVVKKVIGLGLPHPIANIFIAFLCYYIMLLTFGIRPYLAIAGAIAFGLSSYMIVGMSAGHNARIGAIAFMPLVVAGIHLVYSEKLLLGFGVTTAAFSLHMRENHLQITYYLAIIVIVYGLVQLIHYYKEQRLKEWFKHLGVLVIAVLIAIGSFLGPLWSITEYSKYSIRGKSELASARAANSDDQALSKGYAFSYSYGILEPMTLLIPNFYGGSTMNFLVQDRESETYQALVRSGNEQMFNQLANYTSAYWGPQPLSSPYYAGAIIVFLFALGIAFADKKFISWLIPLAVLGILMAWGSSFKAFNYFLFDYLPGYNKFRSVTFALILTLFAMPLLGMAGLEKFLASKTDKATRKRLLLAFGITGGLCLLTWLLAGLLSFTREGEEQLPGWFLSALIDDRRSLLTADAFRSFAFTLSVFILLYFDVAKKISSVAFFAFLILMVTIDLSVVNKRYQRDESFKRRPQRTAAFPMTEADQVILNDKSHYRVYALGNNIGSAFNEAQTSYYHNSIGGYHGAKMRRYQDLLDSCLYYEISQFVRDAQSGSINFPNYGVLNMLNVKYITFGPQRDNIIQNTAANGSAWFVKNIIPVQSPADELKEVCDVNTRTTAVIDQSKFKVESTQWDSTGSMTLVEHKPNYIQYTSESQTNGLAVFSEIYYEKGWKAFIDGQPANILRANYVLRALQVPGGKHTIEFRFEPQAYFTGNAITTASSWAVVLILIGSIVLSFRRRLISNS